MRIKSLVCVLRPRQWLKNLMLFFPSFLSGGIFSADMVPVAMLAFPAFCLASSSGYVLNDLLDVQNDRFHEKKKYRPLARGEFGPATAIGLIVILACASVVLGLLVGTSFLWALLGYLLVSFLYSLWFKNQPILEIFCISAGFLLRLQAGGEAFDVIVSEWMFLSVFLLSIYLVCGKRLSEIKYEGGVAPGDVRPVLGKYPPGFMEMGMGISGAAVLVTYTMYVISHENSIWVIPLCCYGLLAFLQRVLSGRGGDPTRALLGEPVLLAVGIAWVLLVGWGGYGG